MSGLSFRRTTVADQVGAGVSEEMKPRFQNHPFSCRCGHEWEAPLPIDVDTRVFLAMLRATRCPKCGGGLRKLSMGTAVSVTIQEVPLP